MVAFVACFVSHMVVSRSLHVRLDESSAAALSVIRGDGLSDSEALPDLHEVGSNWARAVQSSSKPMSS